MSKPAADTDPRLAQAIARTERRLGLEPDCTGWDDEAGFTGAPTSTSA